MSTVATTTPVAAELDFKDQPGWLGRAVLRARRIASGRGIWALTDQCVVSLGSFATNALLARGLAPAEYGRFGIVLEVILLLNNLHAAIVSYPLSVRGAKTNSAGVTSMVTGALVLTVLLAVPLGLLMALASGAGSYWQLGGTAALALLLWQLQETVRRALMSQMRYGSAVWGDSIRYLGQAAIVWWLARNDQLTLTTAFGSMAFAAVGATALQAAQVGLRRLKWSCFGEVWRTHWSLGKWNLYSTLTTVITVPAFAWVLGYFHGLDVVAVHQAFLNLMKVSHPVLFSTMNLIVPVTAAAWATGGMPAARRAFRIYAWGGAALLLPYFGMMIIMPDLVVRLVYGEHSPYQGHHLIVQLFAISYFLVYVTNVYGAFLGGLEKPREAYKAQLVNTGAAVLIGLPLAAVGGVVGCIIGGTIACLARQGANVYYLRRAQ